MAPLQVTGIDWATEAKNRALAKLRYDRAEQQIVVVEIACPVAEADAVEVVLNDDVLLMVKIAFHSKRLTCDSIQEREHLWDIVDDVWSYRGRTASELARFLPRRGRLCLPVSEAVVCRPDCLLGLLLNPNFRDS